MGDVNFLANEKKDETEKDEMRKEAISWSEVKKGKEEKIEKKNNVNDADISSWLKSLKDGKEEEGKGVKELKKSKEALVEYQKVFSKAKGTAAGKTEISTTKESGIVGFKHDGGIADIIKSKLSFGGGNKEQATLKTNLISSEGVTFFDWKEKTKVFVINLLLTFLIIGTAYGYLFYKEKGISQKTDALISSIEKLKKDTALLEKDIKEIDVFQKKVKIVSSLLGKHIYWTNFFTFLEDNLLDSVYLSGNFVGNTAGDFSLSSKSKTYKDLSDQARVLRNNNKILNVSIKSGKAVIDSETDSQVVDFTMKVSVDPIIFYK